jgi:hypothetical protein
VGQGQETLPDVDAFGCLRSLRARSALDGVSWVQAAWLKSHGAAKNEIGLSARHEQGLRKNNRAENSHQPRHDGASVRCSGSNRPDQPSASFSFMPPFTTRSTSRVISHPAARFAS